MSNDHESINLKPFINEKVYRGIICDYVIVLYQVFDLLSAPGLSKASNAYGMIPDTFLLHIKEYNLIDRLRSLYEAGVGIFHIHGDNDAIVPLNQNSQVIYDRYMALGGNVTLKIVNGKGHEEVPEYFQSQELLTFLLDELSN